MSMPLKNDPTEKILAQLTGLYQKDPEAFEALRKKLIRRTIEEFPEPHRQRAYGMQFQIEAQLHKYKDPLVRMNRMVELFWEQFEKFQVALTDPLRLIAEREQQKKASKVIPLRKLH